tara:strand:- start:11 stop:169 length:159 start_codon:yes stop_codon:yes gene_type:complete
MITEQLKIRRIKNAESACKNATDDWFKDYWYGVFSKLCKMYNKMNYFRKTIH